MKNDNYNTLIFNLKQENYICICISYACTTKVGDEGWGRGEGDGKGCRQKQLKNGVGRDERRG
jgi:hypothetical protein